MCVFARMCVCVCAYLKRNSEDQHGEHQGPEGPVSKHL